MWRIRRLACWVVCGARPRKCDNSTNLVSIDAMACVVVGTADHLRAVLLQGRREHRGGIVLVRHLIRAERHEAIDARPERPDQSVHQF